MIVGCRFFLPFLSVLDGGERRQQRHTSLEVSLFVVSPAADLFVGIVVNL
jgi:hypothetical protein